MAPNSAKDSFDPKPLLAALRAVKKGNFSVRLPTDGAGASAEVAEAVNDVVEMLVESTGELERIGNVVGKEGKITQRAQHPGATGSWAARNQHINSLIADLVHPTEEVSRVI